MLDKLKKQKHNLLSLSALTLTFFIKNFHKYLFPIIAYCLLLAFHIPYLTSLLVLIGTGFIAFHSMNIILNEEANIADSFNTIKEEASSFFGTVVIIYLVNLLVEHFSRDLFTTILKISFITPFQISGYLIAPFLIATMLLFSWTKMMLFYCPFINFAYSGASRWDSFTKSFRIFNRDPLKVVIYMLAPGLLIFLINYFIGDLQDLLTENDTGILKTLSKIFIEQIKYYDDNSALISTNIKQIFSAHNLLAGLLISLKSIYMCCLFAWAYNKPKRLFV